MFELCCLKYVNIAINVEKAFVPKHVDISSKIMYQTLLCLLTDIMTMSFPKF